MQHGSRKELTQSLFIGTFLQLTGVINLSAYKLYTMLSWLTLKCHLDDNSLACTGIKGIKMSALLNLFLYFMMTIRFPKVFVDELHEN